MTWVSVPRYRTRTMTLMRLEPCGHHETVDCLVGYRWWRCPVCLRTSIIQVACELPVTCWVVPGTGEYRPLLR